MYEILNADESSRILDETAEIFVHLSVGQLDLARCRIPDKSAVFTALTGAPLIKGRHIYSDAFGDVHTATYAGKRVMVKYVRNIGDRRAVAHAFAALKSFQAAGGSPGIVSVVAALECTGAACKQGELAVVMEDIIGTSLDGDSNRARWTGKNELRFWELADQILESLFHLHECFLVHRAISAKSIILRKQSVVRAVLVDLDRVCSIQSGCADGRNFTNGDLQDDLVALGRVLAALVIPISDGVARTAQQTFVALLLGELQMVGEFDTAMALALARTNLQTLKNGWLLPLVNLPLGVRITRGSLLGLTGILKGAVLVVANGKFETPFGFKFDFPSLRGHAWDVSTGAYRLARDAFKYVTSQ